jgi:hypothetical protein
LFTYDKVQFYLTGNGASETPLHTTKSGSADGSAPQANSMNLLGLTVPMLMIRYMSVIGLGGSLIALAAVATYWYRTNTRSDDLLIKLKYGNRLVNIHEQDLAPAASLIEVASMDDLARLADRHGTMILHMTRNSRRYYFVQVGGSTYRYAVPTPTVDKSGVRIEGITDRQIGMASPPVAPLDRTSTFPENPAILNPEPSTVFTVEHENIRVDSHRPIGKQAPKEMAPIDDIQEYIINTSVINRQTAPSKGSIDYVIRTGALECDLPVRETSVLGTIKLQPCDPSFAS